MRPADNNPENLELPMPLPLQLRCFNEAGECPGKLHKVRLLAHNILAITAYWPGRRSFVCRWG